MGRKAKVGGGEVRVARGARMVETRLRARGAKVSDILMAVGRASLPALSSRGVGVGEDGKER